MGDSLHRPLAAPKGAAKKEGITPHALFVSMLNRVVFYARHLGPLRNTRRNPVVGNVNIPARVSLVIGGHAPDRYRGAGVSSLYRNTARG